MDQAIDILKQYGEKCEETPKDLLAVFKCAIDEEEHDLMNSLLFPGSPIISFVHPKSKETALHYASLYRSSTTGVIKRLLDLGANINAQSAKDTTPLHEALQCGIDSLGEYLDNSGSHYHFFRNAEMLIKNGADVNICNKSGVSPIHQALLSGYLEAVEIFLKEGNSLPEVCSKTKRIQRLVKCLLKERNNCNTSSNYSTLLDFLIHQKDESFEYILKYTDLDINAKLRGSTILHKAASEGTPLMIKALIDEGADPYSRDNIDATPLMKAISQIRPRNVKCLLDCGVSVNFSQKDVNTLSLIHKPLSLNRNGDVISFHVHNPVLEFLFNRGVDVRAEDIYGITSLDLSCLIGNLEIFEVLLSRGAKINEEDFTTLRYAILGGIADIVKIILNAGISVNCCSMMYGTPLQFAIAKVRNREDIVTILVAFVVKMIASDKYVSQENREALEDETVLEMFKKYQVETERMKLKMISASFKFSFLDILTKEIGYLGEVLMIDNVTEILNKANYKSEFPKYAQDLEKRIQESKHRRPLVNRGMVLFKKHVEKKLPIETVLLIFKPLSLKDLNNFAEACFVKKQFS